MNVLQELKRFYLRFKGEKGIIGFTENGAPIPYFAVTKSAYPVIIVQYAIHAREYITTYLALKQIKEFYKNGKHGSVFFIPAVNIDGIAIALNCNPLYKANANGVDLNVNFPARWGTGKSNVKVRGDMNYIGKRPFSESETNALRHFTLKNKPNATISYHSKGEEVYWEFFQRGSIRERDYLLGQRISEVTGYKLKSTPDSAGGYKDWCVESLRIPAYTIEVGSDELSHPIGKEHLKSVFLKNRKVIFEVTEYLWKKNS